MLSTLISGFMNKHRNGKKFCWILISNAHIRCLPPFLLFPILPFCPFSVPSLKVIEVCITDHIHGFSPHLLSAQHFLPFPNQTHFARGTAILAEGLSRALWCVGWSSTAFSFASPPGKFPFIINLKMKLVQALHAGVQEAVGTSQWWSILSQNKICRLVKSTKPGDC